MVTDGDVNWASLFSLTPAKQPASLTVHMRKTLLLIPLLALAGCAGPSESPGVATAGGGATPSAGASSAPPEGDQLKFAQCMRDNGLPWYKDPEPGQRGVRISIPKGTDKAKVDAAMAACKAYLPNGGEPMKLDPEMQAQLRQFSQCMRENGLPDFPDPSAEGGILMKPGQGGIDPESAEFKKAEQACAQFRPDRPDGAKKNADEG
jgi:hypothetical protein